MPATLCLAALSLLLLAAALSDWRTRRLPDGLTLAMAALYPLYLLANPQPPAWPAALALAAAGFVLGFGLFAAGLLGGGDVKLLAALLLWAGPEHGLLLLSVTAIAGGVLALAYLAWHHLPWPGAAADPDPAGGAPPALAPSGQPAGITLPYGIALAAGGGAVVLRQLAL